MSNGNMQSLEHLVFNVTEKTAGRKDATKPYIGLEHIPSGGCSLIGYGSATDSISTNNVFRAGDTLFGKLRPQLHKSVRVSFDGYCSTDILVLRPLAGVCGEFAANVVQSDAVFAQAIRTEEGTKMPRTSWEALRCVQVFAPQDETEQRKIARILTTLDHLIEKTKALIAKYQAIKQGMTYDLFTRGMDEHGRLRTPQTEAPELYKESELGWIPKEWDEGTIDDYCDIHNHLRFPISSEQREQMKGDYPYYGPTGIFDWLDHYRVEGEYALIGEDGDHFLKYSTQPMTILARGRFNVNNHAHLLKGKNGCTTEWVFTYYCHRDIKNHLTHQGAGRLKLNKAALRAMPLAVPAPPEQQAICKRFFSLNSRVSTEEVQLEKLKKLKTGLMQDLLTGKVRVKIDEPDEVAANV